MKRWYTTRTMVAGQPVISALSGCNCKPGRSCGCTPRGSAVSDTPNLDRVGPLLEAERRAQPTGGAEDLRPLFHGSPGEAVGVAERQLFDRGVMNCRSSGGRCDDGQICPPLFGCGQDPVTRTTRCYPSVYAWQAACLTACRTGACSREICYQDLDELYAQRYYRVPPQRLQCDPLNPAGAVQAPVYSGGHRVTPLPRK